MNHFAIGGLFLFLLISAAGCGDDGAPMGTDAGRGSADAGTIDAGGELGGDPADLARESLPDFVFPPPADENFVAFSGFDVITNEVALVLSVDATVGEVNSLLSTHNALIVGADPESSALLLRGDWPLVDDVRNVAAALDAEPSVAVAITSVAVELDALPPEDVDDRFWTWFRDAPAAESGARGTWGLQNVRAPQLWNLDTFVQRQEGMRLTVGVVDIGFTDSGSMAQASSHPFFRRDNGESTLFQQPHPAEAMRPHNHGTGVAGVIGAAWDDRSKTAGINPWLETVLGSPFGQSKNGRTTMSRVSDAMVRLLRRGDIRVVNASSGLSGIYKAQDLADDKMQNGSFDPDYGIVAGESRYLARRLEALEYVRPGGSMTRSAPYLLVGSAGNAGPFYKAVNNSAVSRLQTELPGRSLSAGSIKVTNAPAEHSASEAQLYAPGQCVGTAEIAGQQARDSRCTFDGSDEGSYAAQTGTSFAAPFVAGLASALWQLDPSLTTTELISIMTAAESTVEVPGAGRRMDAFAAAMTLDARYAADNKRLQRALVNIDDGTLDGNQRRTASGSPDTTIHTPDQRRGDRDGAADRVSMADFRALRDAMAMAMVARDLSLASLVSLDGSPFHFKNDTNEDGCVGIAAADPPWPNRPPPVDCADAVGEDVYPRADFNGDGTLGDATATFRRNDWRDVDVLMDVWPSDDDEATEGWLAFELPGLLPSEDGKGGSADLILDAREPVGPGASFTRVSVRVGPSMEREITKGQELFWTVPIDPLPSITAMGIRGDGSMEELCVESISSLLIGEDRRVGIGACGEQRLSVDESQVYAAQSYSISAGNIVNYGEDSGPIDPIVITCPDLAVNATCVRTHTMTDRAGGVARLTLHRLNATDYDLTLNVVMTPTLLSLPPAPAPGCGGPLGNGGFAWCRSTTDVLLTFDVHIVPGINSSQRIDVSCRMTAQTVESGNAQLTLLPPFAELTGFYAGTDFELGQIGGCFVSSIDSHNAPFDQTAAAVVDPEPGPPDPGDRRLRFNFRTTAYADRFHTDMDRMRMQTLTSTAYVQVRLAP